MPFLLFRSKQPVWQGEWWVLNPLLYLGMWGLHAASEISCGHHHFQLQIIDLTRLGASLVAQLVKKPPAMRETWVPSLGWEDPLEEG